MTQLRPTAPVKAGGTRALERALLVIGVAALGFNLRGAITSLPPVFPELQDGLGLSTATISVLAATPVICFAVFSAFAAWLSRRLGEERVLLAAIAALTAGLLLRGAAPGALLFPGTVLAAAAIAIMNVLLSSLIKRRWPERAGFLIGLYITALSVGAITGSVVAVPLWNRTGGSVGLTLGWLAAPAALAVLLWLPQAGHATRTGRSATGTRPAGPAIPDDIAAIPGDIPVLFDDTPAVPGDVPAASDARAARDRRTAPVAADRASADAAPAVRPAPAGGRDRVAVHRYPLAWHVTLFMGLQSLLYYAALSWLPTILRDRGASADTAGNLLALMGVGNLAVSFLVPMVAQRMRAQHVLVVPTVAAMALGLAGVVYLPLSSAVAWVLILGAGQNAALSLAIFFTMARAPHPAAAASLSALAQSVGYLLASAGPLEVGLLHSVTGSWNLPVAVLFVLNGVLLFAGLLAARDRELPAA
ncbi:MAG TPA: MFS transporter [Trebonia sp.]|nr:MFS transporter [Trebonia sp.]